MAINIIEGNVVNEGMKVGVVCARFNEFITAKLLGGAVDALRRHNVPEEDVTAAWVPGAFEIPVTAKRMAASGKYDAVICLGAVIRGATSHYDVVCNEVSKGIAQVQLETGVPVMMGVLTVDTIEQAIERAGTKAGKQGLRMRRGRHRDGQRAAPAVTRRAAQAARRVVGGAAYDSAARQSRRSLAATDRPASSSRPHHPASLWARGLRNSRLS